MLAAPFAEVVVPPMCFYSKVIGVPMIVHSDDLFPERRAEALLQVDEFVKEIPNQSGESGGTRARQRN